MQSAIEKESWANRLRNVRERQGLSRHDLAIRTGLTVTTIWRMEKGVQEPRATSRSKILHALGFDNEVAFLTGAPRIRNHIGATRGRSNVEGTLDDLRPSEARLLPVFRWGACGDPLHIESAPDPEDYVYPPIGKEHLIGQRGIGIRVRGSSMTRRRIHHGDTVWVNPDRPPRHGRVVLARVWGCDGYDSGGMTVKVWINDGLQGDGDDNDKEGNGILRCDHYEIIGPVVWIQPEGYPPD